MSTEEQLGPPAAADHRLHAALARMAWAAAPTVRLHYDAGADSLVVELVEADAVVEVVALDRLLVEFDGYDARALPTSLCLTGLRTAPNHPAVALAREVLGGEIWAAVEALLAGGSRRADFWLEPASAVEHRTGWRGLADRLRTWPRSAEPRVAGGERLIGVEFTPGRVFAVLTDGAATVLDEELVALDRNDPDAVVAAIAASVRALASRHPGTAAETCAVGVQLGGPVHTATGMVEFYNKPLNDGDESWRGVPLGEILSAATGRRALVFNDAAAMAALEVECGFGHEMSSFAILMVGQGIGAKLVRRGRVEDFPMEIGIFVPVPSVSLRTTPSRGAASIEAKSGVQAITTAVDKLCDKHIADINQAASVAQHSDRVLKVFNRAGRDLARGVAAIQAVVDPDMWAVYGPGALLDESAPAGRAFLGGLRGAGEHLDYGGLWPSLIIPRPISGRLAARAAAVAVLRFEGGMSASRSPLGSSEGKCNKIAYR